MDVVYRYCCGIDVHKNSVTACVQRAEAKSKSRQEKRLFGTFTRDPAGIIGLVTRERRDACRHGIHRCVLETGRFQNDPNFEGYLHFYEYSHGDTGRGVGASHQTGWTGLTAKLIHPQASSSSDVLPMRELVACRGETFTMK